MLKRKLYSFVTYGVAPNTRIKLFLLKTERACENANETQNKNFQIKQNIVDWITEFLLFQNVNPR